MFIVISAPYKKVAGLSRKYLRDVAAPSLTIGALSASQLMKLIGVDVGGTFTDVVYTDTHQVLIHKVPTTPADPLVSVIIC